MRLRRRNRMPQVGGPRAHASVALVAIACGLAAGRASADAPLATEVVEGADPIAVEGLRRDLERLVGTVACEHYFAGARSSAEFLRFGFRRPRPRRRGARVACEHAGAARIGSPAWTCGSIHRQAHIVLDM